MNLFVCYNLDGKKIKKGADGRMMEAGMADQVPARKNMAVLARGGVEEPGGRHRIGP